MNPCATRTRFIALIAAALALGFWVGRQSSDYTTSDDGSPVTPKGLAAPVDIKRPAVTSNVTPSPDATPPNSGEFFRPKFVSVVTDLNRVLQNKISVPLLFGEELNPDFAAVFELSPREKNELKTALQNARVRVAELESRHARIEPKGPKEFTISIPPFPAEGGAVFDELTKSIRSTLGETRHPLYLQLSRYDFEGSSAFGMFGLGETVINVKPMRNEKGGPTATGTMSSNQETGTMSKTLDTDPDFLGVQYPLIYQRMIASGLLRK
jgi:hypothetical protein